MNSDSVSESGYSDLKLENFGQYFGLTETSMTNLQLKMRFATMSFSPTPNRRLERFVNI